MTSGFIILIKKEIELGEYSNLLMDFFLMIV